MGDTNLTDAPVATANVKPVARWRRVVGGFLVVLVCILAPLSVLAVWLHYTVLDTDQYVATVGPLAGEPAVQEAVATRVTNSIVSSTDLESRLTAALPPKAAFAAPAVANGIERVVHDTALRFAQSEQFVTLWERANRRAHTQLVAVLEGKGSDKIETKNGQVVVRLGPVVEKVRAALNKVGIDVFSGAQAQPASNQFVLLDSEQLSKAQSGVEAFDKLVIVLPILTIALFVIAVLLSRNRRRTILRTALGVALAGALLLTAFNVGRSVYLDALGPNVNREAAANIYDQILGFLRVSLRSLFVLGVLGVIGAWLAGPGKAATKIRESILGLFGGRERALDAQPSAIAAFTARHRSTLQVVVATIGLGILVALSHPGPLAVLAIAIIVLVCLAIIEVLSRSALPADPVSL